MVFEVEIDASCSFFNLPMPLCYFHVFFRLLQGTASDSNRFLMLQFSNTWGNFRKERDF